MHDRPGQFGPRYRAFARDRGGAIAPMFAALIVAVILVVGVGLDVGRQMSAKNSLQDAVDATGFALAHLPVNTTPKQLQDNADTWVRANLQDGASIADLSVVATPSTGQITITATRHITTTLMALAGFTQMTVSAHSTVNWAPSRLEVALVLDNTGSMNSNNKIQTLITASHELVTTLFQQTNGDPTAVKISVVPFSMTVNVGPQNRNAPWMSGVLPPEYATALQAAYPGISWPIGQDLFSTANTNRFTLFDQLGEPWAGCVESRPAPYDVQETAPTSGDPATLFTPFFAPDEQDGGYPNSYLADPALTTWAQKQGDVGKYNNNAWARGPSPWFPYTGYHLGPNAGCELAPLLRLTNDQSAVHTEIDQMRAIGDTNLAMGMVWGWHTLSPLGPFADGVPYSKPNTKKVVVFLTDGLNQSLAIGGNNNSYYSGLGYAWQNRLGTGYSSTTADRATALDARTTMVCDNMRAVGITVYTVRIDLKASQSPAVLQRCASSPNDFFDVPNPADLSTAFATIAGSISQLRLAN